MFNSYVKLPEGIYVYIYIYNVDPGLIKPVNKAV